MRMLFAFRLHVSKDDANADTNVPSNAPFQTASVMLLPLVLDIDGIWYSVVVAELMAIVISAFFLVQKRKKYHYM